MKFLWMAFLSGALIVGGVANAAKSKPKDKPAKVVTAALVCPVTGDKIPSKDKAAGHSVYQGKTYYFCCAACKPAFDKDPAKYTKKADKKAEAPSAPKAKLASLICPVTGDKIPSKEKAAGSSVYGGKTYYFCCAGCKPEFDKDPAKYTAKLDKKVHAEIIEGE